ncbi:metal-binding protein ZinT [Rhodobacterales bacterium 59_46_T64]|nr:metal-binding protein ZinT [Rhodobacterales bacterium 59_46_T64]
MRITTAKQISALALGALVALSAPVAAETAQHGDAHKDATRHAHDHGADDIHKGYFSDEQIKARTLSDWAGEWQSVYPLLQNGDLDSVLKHKAEHGAKTFDEYKAYYTAGYATDVERIHFDGNIATFFRNGVPLQGRYESDGFEVLTYDAGNRGVRYVFKKVNGDADAPAFFQFSDHKIAPAAADHFHLYWGNDRAALLKELTNWPTYYPAKLTAKEIVEQMH